MTNMQRWIVSAGTPDGSVGEGRGWVDVDADATEEEARAAYLAQRPAGWEIFSIEPAPAEG